MLLSATTTLVFTAVLALGVVWIDLTRNFACFDGDEPACDSQSASFLAEVRASSWVMAALATGAISASWWIAMNPSIRHPLRAVLALSIVALCLAAVLAGRLTG